MTGSTERKMILIADDEANLRLLIAATIGPKGHAIVQAADGDQAWDLIVEKRPDVALLDVQMPGRTGLELTRAIRGDAALAGTRVILLSSKAQVADIEAGLAAGADLYLTKPFAPRDLRAALEQALEIS
jgi:CheY-like chemotaxis protein